LSGIVGTFAGSQLETKIVDVEEAKKDKEL